MWRGESLDGKTIFLHAEQGFGDAIQFIRYAPLVKERGGRVIVLCQDSLTRLLARSPGVDQWIGSTAPVPNFDVHLPLLSLPGIFHTTPATLPTNIPYIFAEPNLVLDWRERLGTVPGLKVGITWQGNPDHKRDRFRSIPLTAFEPLAAVNGVHLFSLQKGAGLEQLRNVADRFPIEDPGPLDFVELAAAMTNLDLIISCDTAIAHLAGALGRPVWVALSYTPDWRWLLVRPESPWYPTMRLFRQKIPGDWNAVFREMASEMNDLTSIS
jgi:Glycosyltransferase family 9 (heptosyltransferase)